MGCGSSVAAKTGSDDAFLVQASHIWTEALKTIDDEILFTFISRKPRAPKIKSKNDLVIRRSGWKTVRVFVSSTFRDFHEEREILVKKVFPDLRAWCEGRRIHLVECDLRWGVPKDSTTEETLRTCLGEIDRCYQDNVMPFFLNMTSHRVGWIPNITEVPEMLSKEYNWINGLSVTEMEIMHGAFRKGNPNALFMLRDPSFLKTIPKQHRKIFRELDPAGCHKLDLLKRMIKDRFSNVVWYKCQYDGISEDTKKISLKGLEAEFSQAVYKFFKKRIDIQYPLPKIQLDPYQVVKEKHESFMKSRGQTLFGRDPLMQQIDDYVCGVANNVPLLVLGEAGIGKSSIMAKIADVYTTRAMNQDIPGGGEMGWYVFYHFVGAVPGSTENLEMLKRLLLELKIVNESTMPKDGDEAVTLCISSLTNPNTRPILIIVDALNQMDEDRVSELVNWLPRKLAPQIRCIFSIIPETPQHKSLCSRDQPPNVLFVEPLNLKARESIVENMLGLYNKRLDEQQMADLMKKQSSENPLWLSIACEELRVFGMFRQLSDKINQLPDGLLELEKQVIDRFEQENGGNLVVATLCLLETSARGLLENELLCLLADEDNLMFKEGEMPPDEKADVKREKKPQDLDKLPAFKWAGVYRALRPFIRPFGDSGEGRLDFYHRSFSKAVRQKYFSQNDDSPDENKYRWWHGKLADYFEISQNKERRFEEYPEHLVKLGEKERLQIFLSEWDVIDEWVHEEFSYRLVSLWREAADLETLGSCYSQKIIDMENEKNANLEVLELRCEKITRICAQSGQWDTAFEMLEKAKYLEEVQLGKRPERILEIYHLAASIEDEMLRTEGFVSDSQAPMMLRIIENFEKVVSISKTLSGNKYKFKTAAALNRLSFHVTGYTQLKEGSYAKPKRATEAVEEAIAIYKELNDELHVADCLITRGLCETHGSAEQLKYYQEAEKIVLRVAGEINTQMERLHINYAIFYEEGGDYYRSYDHFYKVFEVTETMHGLEHPKTHRHIDTLREAMYQEIAQELGREIPDPHD